MEQIDLNNSEISNFQENDQLSKYKILKKVGKGTYSTVYLCEDEEENEYAMKVHYDTDKISEGKRNVIKNDSFAIQKIQGHESIIYLKEVIDTGVLKVDFIGPDSYPIFSTMVLETLKGGELFFHLRKYGKFQLRFVRVFFKQLVDGVAFIHSKGFCHRDLKPWNIMFSDDLTQLKIIDFGYATPITEELFKSCSSHLKKALPGTQNYLAPELYEENITFSLEKADVYALGVILFNLLTSEQPFKSFNDPKFKQFQQDPSKILLKYLDYIPQQELDELCDLFKNMLNLNISERLDIKQVQSHPFITSYPLPTIEEIELEQQQRITQPPYLSEFQQHSETKPQIKNKHGRVNSKIPTYRYFTFHTTVFYNGSLQSILEKIDQKVIELKGNIEKINESIFQAKISESSTYLNIEKNLIVNLEFGQTNNWICCDLSRIQGDYLSFMDFYVIISKHFNQ